MAALDQLRDKWDGITPRERMLVVLLGVSFVVCVLLYVAFGISDKLDGMEAQNARMRKALEVLQEYRVHGRQTAAVGPVAQIGPDPVKLESYLDKAAEKVGIKVPSYKPRTPQVKQTGFTQHTVELNVNTLTIDQVKDFLEAIENDNKTVVVTSLQLKRNFSDREKLDLKMEVSTFSKPAAAPAAGAGTGTGTGAAPAAPAGGAAQ
jgi:type II secretory pathway component PulM